MLHTDLYSDTEYANRTLLANAIETQTSDSIITALEIIPTLSTLNYRAKWVHGRASPLHMACHYKQTEIITALLEANADPHYGGELGDSAFQLAYKSHNWSGVSLLLKGSKFAGDPATITLALFEFFRDSTITGSRELFCLLVTTGVDINLTRDETMPIKCILTHTVITAEQKTEYLRYLLMKTAPRKIDSYIVRQALMCASESGLKDCTLIMLSYDSFKNASAELCFTLSKLFHRIVNDNEVNESIFHIIKGANVNINYRAFSSIGNSALHDAVIAQGHLIITALLLAGANPALKNSHNMTPHQYLDAYVAFYKMLGPGVRRLSQRLSQSTEKYMTAQRYHAEITNYKFNLAIIFRSIQLGNAKTLSTLPLDLLFVILSMAAPDSFNEIWNTNFPNSKLKSMGSPSSHNLGFLLWVRDKQSKSLMTWKKIICFKYIYNELRTSQGYFTTNALKNWEHLTDNDYLSAVATYAAQNQTSRTAVALSLMNHVNGDKNHPELKMLIAQTLKSEQPGLFNHALGVFRVNSGADNQVDQVKKM